MSEELDFGNIGSASVEATTILDSWIVTVHALRVIFIYTLFIIAQMYASRWVFPGAGETARKKIMAIFAAGTRKKKQI